MNFYNWHIGDYAAHTRGLTLLEDLAYRRLLDQYYLAESPLQGTAAQIAKAIGMKDNQAEVEYVLSTYFHQSDGGFANRRADQEIDKYLASVAQKILAGKASAERRRSQWSNGPGHTTQQTLSACSTGVELSKIQEPRTKNQEPIKKTKPPELDPKTIEGLNVEAWQRWIKYRRDIGKGIKPASQAAAARKLADLGKDQSAAVEQSIAQGWQGIFPLKDGPKKTEMVWSGMDKIDYSKGGNTDGSF